VNRKLAVLVISFDNYRDVWRPFFDLFTRFWPDCPYRLYLGTNKEDFNYPGVTVIKSGADISWADNVRNYLSQIEEDYVLTFLDDYFLSQPVQSEAIAIKKALEIVLRDGIDVFSFTRPNISNQYRDEADVYFIDPHSEYCVNTAVAIRKKQAFLSLLKPGFSAWDFEIKNSRDVNESGIFPGLFVTSGQYYFRSLKNGIWRGKWVRSSVRFCQHLGIVVDTTHRPFMSKSDVIWEFAKENGRKILHPSLRRLVKKILVKLGFSKRFVSLD